MSVHVDLPSANQQFILSLCSGGGGLDLGVRLALPAARTVGYVEIEAFACATLVRQMEAARLDAAPLWTDLRSFRGRKWRGAVDGIISGYPCQPFSVAGRQRGVEDPRHLWPIIRRNIRIVRPTWCFFENVANHLRIGFDQVARDLHALGYDIAAGVFSASEVGAPHGRKRLFILAVARSGRWGTGQPNVHAGKPDIAGSGDLAVADTYRQRRAGEHTLLQQRGSYEDRAEVAGSGTAVDEGVEHAPILGRREGRAASSLLGGRDTVAIAGGLVGDADAARLEGRHGPLAERPDQFPAWPPGPSDDAGWRWILDRWPDAAPAIESDVRRMAHGMAARVDRLRLLGNGVVPEQAAYAFVTLARDLAEYRDQRRRSVCGSACTDELIDWG